MTYADTIDDGFAGRGAFDPFSKTLGRQVDLVDKAFFKWKKCIQCVPRKGQGMMQAYTFDSQLNSCGKLRSTGLFSRKFDTVTCVLELKYD